ERFVGIPAEAVEYFVHPTHYDTTNTDRDLAGSGIACPRVPDYLPTLVRFFLEHREADVGAMVLRAARPGRASRCQRPAPSSSTLVRFYLEHREADVGAMV